MHKSNSEVGKSIVLSQAKVSIEEHLHASTYELTLVVELIPVLLSHLCFRLCEQIDFVLAIFADLVMEDNFVRASDREVVFHCHIVQIPVSTKKIGYA